MLGPPKRTDQAHHERLAVYAALAVFSADGLSSVAYATEEILYVLTLAGPRAGAYLLPIGLAIVALVFIVAASYSQIIQAYPSGGGAYLVAKENLGVPAGLTAGAALLVDYVLTVAVSAAAGAEAVISAIPALHGHQVALALGAVWLIAWVNLRGVRESGSIFAVPTYAFVSAICLLVGAGLWRVAAGGWHPATNWTTGFSGGLAGGVTWFLLLRAFSSGCTALTGLEAVSNGVQAFRPPEEKNAIRTMNLERTILYAMFGGITILAFGFGILPRAGETVLSQIARNVFGGGALYYLIQAATALILLLAANTAYADFPRLAGLIARDGFLPRRLANRGDTLVFHHGIYLLAGLASALVVIFHGDTHLLIPLYAIGVFTAFTLSQTGMVRHWLTTARTRLARWKTLRPLLINALGALLCAIVLVIIAVTKFAQGAWIILLVIPALVGYFLHVRGYYNRFGATVKDLASEPMSIDNPRKLKVVLAVSTISPVVNHSLRVARRIADDIRAVHVAVDPEEAEQIRRRWSSSRYGGVPLIIIPSPYREVVGPLRQHLDRMLMEDQGAVINLLVPVVVTNEPFDEYLHNGSADQLLREMRYSEGVVLTEIPFYVDMKDETDRVIAYRRQWRKPSRKPEQ
jgi:amino acid transporter